MEEHKDRFRMYGLVPYNISPIQQGIQYGHALQEYNNILGETYGGRPSAAYDEIGDEFNTWRLEDKTFIILNGGTSMTMEQHVKTLKDAGIHIGVFEEPDLNNMTSGIVFLVPEQVYKRDEWPDFKTWLLDKNPSNTDDGGTINRGGMARMSHDDLKVEYNILYHDWVTMVGGEKNAFLKEFTSQFRLA
jgi:hypothetical protein